MTMRAALCLCLLSCLLIAPAMVQADPSEPAGSTTQAPSPLAWSDEAIALWSSIPIQAEGRVKPFQTWARFALLGINGRTRFELGDDKIGAVPWALHTMFYPSDAAHFDVFLIEDSAVLEAIGLESVAKRKRDRYAFADIEPGIERLMSLTEGIRDSQQRDRNFKPSVLQRHLLTLSSAIRTYRGVLRAFDWVRAAPSSATGIPLLPAGTSDSYLGVLRAWEEQKAKVLAVPFMEFGQALPRLATGDPQADGLSDAQLAAFLYVHALPREVGTDVGPALIPPPSNEVDARWTTANEYAWYPALAWMSRQRFEEVREFPRPGFRLQPNEDTYFDDAIERGLPLLQAIYDARGEDRLFIEATQVWSDFVRERAAARGEYEHGDLEVFFYRMNPFFWAWILFLIGFALITLSWLKSDTRWIWFASWGPVVLGALLLVIGIVLRCIIRGKPPVSTLYETILFITACGVISFTIIEIINRRRIALPLAAVLGAAGMWLAGAYETLDGKDTMPQLQAVLDTNFWLGTHVTTITFGYAAGLIAAFIGHVYVLGKAFGIKANDHAWYGTLYRMTYGTMAFCLLLSLIGTILGGIWANDSWGRFWGWDPKENGALMICLWTTAVLHARMGGYIKGFGMAMSAVFLGCVVAWSWWGVNQLSVGLHSYGFTSGITRALTIAGAFEAAVLLTGFVTYYSVIRPRAK